LFAGFKEDAVLRIAFLDHRLAALGISLPEHLQNVSFHKLTEFIAHKNLHLHNAHR